MEDPTLLVSVFKCFSEEHSGYIIAFIKHLSLLPKKQHSLLTEQTHIQVLNPFKSTRGAVCRLGGHS